MIANVFGCPSYTWLSLKEFSLKHGLSIARINEFRLQPEENNCLFVLSDLQVVYVESVEVLQSWVTRLNELETKFVIVLSVSASELEEQGIPIVEQIDLLDILLSTTRVVVEEIEIRTVSILERSVRGYKPTLLGNLHNAFYRIKEKSQRDATSKRVYDYLSNVRQSKPKTGIKLIDELLNDDRIVRFREITRQVANDESQLDFLIGNSDFDSFEIMFVLKKSGSL